METAIVVLLLAAVLGGAARYLLRAKKKGQQCFGCPYAKNCGGCGTQSE